MAIDLVCNECCRFTSRDYHESEGHLFVSLLVSGSDFGGVPELVVYRYACSSTKCRERALENALRELRKRARKTEWFSVKPSDEKVE